MQLFNADATMFSKTFKKFFCPQKVEKTTLKICSEFLKSTFFLTALTAQTAQTEEFLFQNVAYWLTKTIYRTIYRTFHIMIFKFYEGTSWGGGGGHISWAQMRLGAISIIAFILWLVYFRFCHLCRISWYATCDARISVKR